MSKPATLKDVARAAGVSPASVSRVMAGKEGVTSELHSRIMAAAARLDYKPNLAARALASRRSALLAVVLSPLEDGVAARTAVAALGALRRRRHGVLLVSETAAERLDVSGLATRGVDAVLFVGRAPLDAESEALSTRGLAWIAIADSDGEGASGLDLGRLRAVELACRYLQEVGHRSLGLLGPPGLGLGDLVSRVGEGTAIELARPAWPGDALAIGGALHRLLDAPARPTAIVCADDLAALAVIRECSVHGISVPRDVAVVGFGDEPFARLVRPALTTVRPACAEMGGRAADALLEVLDGRTCPDCAAVNKLVVRETTERPGNLRRST